MATKLFDEILSDFFDIRHVIERYEAIGSLPSTTYRETVPQRNERVLMAALEVLHS